MKDATISEKTLSKIDKSKQPELRNLNIDYCIISGRYLFDLQNNVGWPKLQYLRLYDDLTDN